MPPNIVCDTSCLILLWKIDELSLLKQLYGGVTITPEVAKEFNRTLPDWVRVIDYDKTIPKPLNVFLDNGEASIITLALELEAPLLIIDELRGRKMAKSLNLEVTGTLGVLLAAKNQGLIEYVKPYLEKINKTNFRMSNALAQEILKKAGEKE